MPKEIRHLKIREISLVEDPANPHSLIEIVKAKHANSVGNEKLSTADSYAKVAKSLGRIGIENMLTNIAKARAISTGKSVEEEYAGIVAEQPALYAIWKIAKQQETTSHRKG